MGSPNHLQNRNETGTILFSVRRQRSLNRRKLAARSSSRAAKCFLWNCSSVSQRNLHQPCADEVPPVRSDGVSVFGQYLRLRSRRPDAAGVIPV